MENLSFPRSGNRLRYARGSASTLLGLLCYLTWYWQEHKKSAPLEGERFLFLANS